MISLQLADRLRAVSGALAKAESDHIKATSDPRTSATVRAAMTERLTAAQGEHLVVQLEVAQALAKLRAATGTDIRFKDDARPTPDAAGE